MAFFFSFPKCVGCLENFHSGLWFASSPSTFTVASWLLSSQFFYFFLALRGSPQCNRTRNAKFLRNLLWLSQASLIGEHGWVSMGMSSLVGEPGRSSMGVSAWARERGCVSMRVWAWAGELGWVFISVSKILTADLKIFLCWGLCWLFKGINSQGWTWIWLLNHNYRPGF